jgi:septum formation protein
VPGAGLGRLELHIRNYKLPIPDIRAKGSSLQWILASASPRRKAILSRLGLRFTIDPSGIPEPDRNFNEKPPHYAIRVARLKAEEVAKRHKSGMLLSADTIVVLENALLGKPADKEDARWMLQRLSSRWHEVITGVCIIDCAKHRAHSVFSRTRVHFRRLTPPEIEWYLNSREYRDKAGAYGAQGRASIFIDKIEGCFFNVVGFPVAAFDKLCRKSGISLISAL